MTSESFIVFLHAHWHDSKRNTKKGIYQPNMTDADLTTFFWDAIASYILVKKYFL